MGFVEAIVAMAEHGEEMLIEQINVKIDGDGDSLSSDSDDEKSKASVVAEAIKPKIYHLWRSPPTRFWAKESILDASPNAILAADVFLWMNKKASAVLLGGATAIWILIKLMEYHLLTLVCHCLILSLAILFLWSNATTLINK
ncbi:Reticulon [Musa troglodytarum]|nr:Reticulon [Musa troglodytarum]